MQGGGMEIVMKTALVTGASRGIGAEIAKALAKEGAFVYVNCSKSIEDARLLADQIGGKAIMADVSDEKAVRSMIEEIERERGGVDILVNNAGISLVKMLCDTTPEEWDRVFAINMRGAYLTARAVIDAMVRRRWGRIVNISSMWGEVGASCEVAYSASKAAMIGFTKALAKELSLSGIRVNAVTPGVVDTQMNAEFSKEEMSDIINEIPLGRMASTSDIASVVTFLCSEQSDYITGQVIGVSGGMVI